MASDDSPDEDGTIESIGSKSIGSSASSSHSDMSSPMFKPESIIVCIFSLTITDLTNYKRVLEHNYKKTAFLRINHL